MTLLYMDPLFLKHDTGRHVEVADRLRAITARLEKAGLPVKCQAGTYRPLTEEAVGRLHAPRMVVAPPRGGARTVPRKEESDEEVDGDRGRRHAVGRGTSDREPVVSKRRREG